MIWIGTGPLELCERFVQSVTKSVQLVRSSHKIVKI